MKVLIMVAGSLALVSAVGVVLFKQTIYSALSLVLTIGMLSVLFLALNAQFLFVAQLIVYAGAVMVLFVFIIALLSPSSEERPHVDIRFLIGAVAVAGITTAMALLARNGITYSGTTFHGAQVGSAVPNGDPYHTFAYTYAEVNAAGNVQTVGSQLFTVYLLPFEITSLLLLVAAIGAVYLSRRTA